MDNLRLGIEWDVDEAALKSSMDASRRSIETAEASVEELTAAVERNMAKFSDSAKEVQAYKDSLVGLNTIAAPADPLGLDDVKAKIADVTRAKQELEQYYKAGRVSASEYKTILASLVATEKQLNDQLTARPETSAPSATPDTAALSKYEQMIQSVADEYRGLLAEGSAAYNQLDKKTQDAVVQLIRQKDELHDIQAAIKSVEKAYADGDISMQHREQALTRLGVLERETIGTIKQATESAKAGFEQQNVKIREQEGILQRLQRTAALYQKGMLEATRSDNLEKYRQKLEQVNAEMAKMTKGTSVGGAAGGWNGLQNSINQISRELPAFTYSIQTGFMAISNNLPMLADEIGRIKKENDALVASGKKGVPVWKQLVTSLLSWQTAMSVGIMLLTVYGKEIGEWVKGLFQGGKAAQEATLRISAMNKALESSEYGKAIKDLAELRSAIQGARDGVVSKDDALKLYNTTIGKTAGEIKEWQSLEQWMVDNEQKYLQFMFRKAQAQAMLQVAIDKTVEAEKKALEGPDWQDYAKAIAMTGFTNLGAGAELQNQLGIANLRAQSGRGMQLFAEANRELQEYAKANGFDLYQFSDSKTKQSRLRIVAAHKSLMDEIRAIDAEYAKEYMTDQEKEQAAFDEKFAKLRDKVIAFNKNPEHKIKIPMELVDEMQERLQDQLTYNQGTASIVKVYQTEFDAWKEFEELKNKTSEEYARERFGTLADYYKDVETRIWDSINAIDPTTTDAGELKRLEEFNKLLEQISRYRQADQDKQYAEALQLAETIGQAELKIRKKYQDALAALGESATEEQRAQLLRGYQEDLRTLIEGSGEYQKVMDVIDSSSRVMLTNAFKSGKDTVFSLIDGLKTATDQQKANLKKLFGQWFDQGINEATVGNYELVSQMVAGFDQLVVSAGQFDGTMSSALRTVGTMVGQVSEMAKTLGQGLGDAGKGMSSAGGIGAIVGAVFSILGSVISIMEAQGAKEKKRLEENRQFQIKQLDATTTILEYQLSLIKDIYGTERVNAYAKTAAEAYKTVNESLSQLGDLRYLRNGNNDNDLSVNVINRYGSVEAAEQRAAELQKKIKRQWWRANRDANAELFTILASLDNFSKGATQSFQFTWDTIEDITQDEVTEIRRLIEQGAFDDVTKAQLENVIEQWEIWKEVMNQMREELTGVSFNSLTDGIVDMFQQGKTSVEDFTEFFEKQMQASILKAFSRDSVEKQLQPWYELFAQYSEDGLTEGEIVELRDMYTKLMQGAQKDWEELKKVTGVDFESDTPGGSLSSSGIERITEQSATELMGIARSTYDLNKQQLAAIQQLLSGANNSYSVFVQQLRHQAAIEANTAETVEQLKLSVVELKAISKNTSKQSNRAYGGN